MVLNFNCLYLFDNEEIYILEIKRIGLPPSATKAENNQWLLVEKDTLSITQLVLVALNSNHATEERFFRQGFLSFDDDQAIYIREFTSVQNILQAGDIEELSEPLTLAIQQRFSER